MTLDELKALKPVYFIFRGRRIKITGFLDDYTPLVQGWISGSGHGFSYPISHRDIKCLENAYGEIVYVNDNYQGSKSKL